MKKQVFEKNLLAVQGNGFVNYINLHRVEFIQINTSQAFIYVRLTSREKRYLKNVINVHDVISFLNHCHIPQNNMEIESHEDDAMVNEGCPNA